MKTIENIKKVALVFFIITGLIHLSSAMFISNNLALKQASIINKTMDIPFILTGLIYGLSSLRLSLTNPQKKHKILDITLVLIIILALIGLLVINLTIPNLKT